MTPVIEVRRCAMSSARRAAIAAIWSAMKSWASTKPPRASISWKCRQACSRQLIGEILDEPRTARGVQHPSDV